MSNNYINDTNKYLNYGLTKVFKELLTKDTRLENYEINTVNVYTYTFASWNTMTIKMGIKISVSTSFKKFSGKCDVELGSDGNIDKISNESLEKIREVVLPAFNVLIEEINKSKGLNSLINKL